jgi:ribose-phosphate pyrophosphokinase
MTGSAMPLLTVGWAAVAREARAQRLGDLAVVVPEGASAIDVVLGLRLGAWQYTTLQTPDPEEPRATIARAARLCRANGAREVIAVATHGLFSGGASVLLEEGTVDGIVVTDAVPFYHVSHGLSERIEVASITELIADAIRRAAPSGLQRGGCSVDVA